MPDNVVASVGAVTVATEEDAKGAQHQRMVNEIMHGDNPVNISTQIPQPVSSDKIEELLGAMLIEMRVHTYMMFQMWNTECEPPELMRAALSRLPVTP